MLPLYGGPRDGHTIKGTPPRSSPVGSRQALYRMASLAPGAALVSVVSGWKQICS